LSTSYDCANERHTLLHLSQGLNSQVNTSSPSLLQVFKGGFCLLQEFDDANNVTAFVLSLQMAVTAAVDAVTRVESDDQEERDGKEE